MDQATRCSILEKLKEKDGVQFLMRLGYIVLFLAVLSEQIGLPVPAALVLIAAGSLAGGLHRMSFLLGVGDRRGWPLS